MGKQRFILSYVNDGQTTVHYDRVFYDMDQLVRFAEHSHPEYTSYQIIVTQAAE